MIITNGTADIRDEKSRMQLLGRKELDNFARNHADVRPSIQAWTAEVEEAHWKTTQDIKDRFPSASFLSNNRIIFNLKGNTYRLIVQVAFQTGIVLVLRIGTHSEYNNWQ